MVAAAFRPGLPESRAHDADAPRRRHGGRNDRWKPPTAAELGYAAAAVWLGQEPEWAIAARLGISRRTLTRWKQREAFQAALLAAELAWSAEFGRHAGRPFDAPIEVRARKAGVLITEGVIVPRR
jgi:hypothetical protein